MRAAGARCTAPTGSRPGAQTLAQLQQLHALKVLNLKGNPFANEAEYRSQVLVQLPKLHYLDYAMVTAEEVGARGNACGAVAPGCDAAVLTADARSRRPLGHQRFLLREQFRDAVLEGEDREATRLQEAEQHKAQAAAAARLREAHVSFLPTLFVDMFDQDPEHARLSQLPGQSDLQDECVAVRGVHGRHLLTPRARRLLAEYHSTAEGFREEALRVAAGMAQERRMLEEALHKLRAEKTATSIELVRRFDKVAKRVRLGSLEHAPAGAAAN